MKINIVYFSSKDEVYSKGTANTRTDFIPQHLTLSRYPPKRVKSTSVFFLENGLDTPPYQVAPEVCIEIRSPSNTRNEMQEKKDLYLAKGAEEVWVCDEDGLVVFYNARGEIQRANQFPEFPTTLALDFPPA